MTNQIGTVKVRYSGLAGSINWLTRFHFQKTDLSDINPTDAAAAQSAVGNFLVWFEGLVPSTLHMTPQDPVAVFDQVTGTLLHDVSGGGSLPTVNGSNATAWINGTGVRVMWTTGAILHGRHVHGSTAILPVCEDQFVDGDPDTGALAAGASAAAALITGMTGAGLQPVVYSRPNVLKAYPGSSSLVITGQLLGAPGVLRRRKV